MKESRSSCIIIHGAQCRNEHVEPLFKNFKGFLRGDSKALNQERDCGLGHVPAPGAHA